MFMKPSESLSSKRAWHRAIGSEVLQVGAGRCTEERSARECTVYLRGNSIHSRLVSRSGAWCHACVLASARGSCAVIRLTQTTTGPGYRVYFAATPTALSSCWMVGRRNVSSKTSRTHARWTLGRGAHIASHAEQMVCSRSAIIRHLRTSLTKDTWNHRRSRSRYFPAECAARSAEQR